MAVTARSIAGALLALLGPEGLSDDDASRARAAVDGLVPRWVARPASLEQVCGVLALAHDAELAVVPRGSGSSLELGHPPARADLVLDLRGLDRVLEWSPDDLTVTVEAGITAGALARRLDARRQLLPLDPPGAGARTLGGLAATNASGPLRARYGTLRDLLLGVRFVQADGVLVTAARPADAQAFVVALLDSPLQPNRVELLDGAMLGACGLGPAAAAVAVGIGSVADAVRAQGEAVVALARRAGSTVAPTPEDFWARYEREATRGDVRLRVATGVDGLAAALDAIARADGGARAGGCAAHGLLDVALGVAEPPAVAAVVARLRELVAPAGGGVVVQRAPRAVRAALDPWGPVDAGPLALMRGLKDAFDPRRVLNPGRFVGGL
ncbi:MAG: FAD-binding oxidoreductase [Candidatus Rokubacteria bacterium]|nr:FAD-binding oxidoreductase [Candidatus Rokubacteria bacterium]